MRSHHRDVDRWEDWPTAVKAFSWNGLTPSRSSCWGLTGGWLCCK